MGGEPVFYLAAAGFGLTLGAEMDLIIYIASNRFGLRRFGPILDAYDAGRPGRGPGPAGGRSGVRPLRDLRAFLGVAIGLAVMRSLWMFSLGRQAEGGGPEAGANLFPA